MICSDHGFPVIFCLACFHTFGPKTDPKSIVWEITFFTPFSILFSNLVLGRLGERFWDRFGVDFEAQKGSKREPKWSSKRSKFEHKIQHPKGMLSRASWIRLGPILVHFGVVFRVRFWVRFRRLRAPPPASSQRGPGRGGALRPRSRNSGFYH